MNRNTLFWGFILIMAGSLLLLDNLGILNVDVWSLIWPLFLIALGISIIWGRFFHRTAEGEHASVPLEGAGRARVRIRHGAGRLDITGGANSGLLAEGTFGGGLDLDKRRSGDVLEVTMSVPSQGFPFFWGPGNNLDWSFRLAREIPLVLELETGANDARIDLSDLLVGDLRLKSGASSTDLNFPTSAGFTRADIETGAASVNLRVPAGVAARIHTQSGLSSINVDETHFPRQGSFYQSPDYDTASNKVDINIQTGVGSIDVRQGGGR